jgi:hypothetical protein
LPVGPRGEGGQPFRLGGELYVQSPTRLWRWDSENKIEMIAQWPGEKAFLTWAGDSVALFTTYGGTDRLFAVFTADQSPLPLEIWNGRYWFEVLARAPDGSFYISANPLVTP